MQHSRELTKENWHEDFIAILAGSFKPDVYVELGLYHCELFNKIIPHANKLYGVDINQDAGQWMTQSEKTFFFHGTTDEFAAEIETHNIKIDLLFIDADHSKESVLKDFWNYFPFVKDHGLILLHDTHPKNLQYTEKGYCGDAYLVIEELKKYTDEFELMTIPIHPGLTLIRKRKTQLPLEITLGFSSTSFINDPHLLESIKKVCYTKNDVRAGWIGSGLPNTNNDEYIPLAKWSTEHWAMYYSFLDMVDLPSKTKILDIGCGTGHSTICLSEILNKNIIGIDSDEEAISFANKFNKNEKTLYINQDFFKFESSEKFKYIFALEILEHISADKHYLFIDKCLSLLSEDGMLFVTTPNSLGEEDADYGHIGFLNRGRATNFIKKYKNNFVEANFIDNKKLLCGGPDIFVKKIDISQFDSSFENLSHFRFVFRNQLDLDEKGSSLPGSKDYPIQQERLQDDSIGINNLYLNNSNVVAASDVVEEKNIAHNYRIVCITQVYNELRKGNLERFWKFIEPVCDGLVVYDDGSTDGSYGYMLDKAIFTLRAGENDFKNEVNHKKILLEYALKLQPDFILWLDADEVLTANAEVELQNLCKYADENNIDGLSFHEINLWRSHSWKRIDNSYDLGWFVRLWRVTPELAFKDSEPGLHQQQFPHSISKIERTDRVGVIHYGFASDRSLAFKYLVYRSHGQTGWALERLLDENTLTLEKVDEKLFPTGLYIDDDKPAQRSFSEALKSLDDYKEEVFKPRISIVCLIYKSTDWLKFVYEQVLKYTDLHDKEFYFVANDANEEVLRYLDQNYIPHYVWNNSPEQRKEWYINNVYRAWNYAAEKAKGDYLLFINSDMAFSENWVENLFGKLNGSNCVASRLVESGKLLSGDHAVSKNFGRTVNDYDETAFQEYVKTISADELVNGGLFMPLLIRKDDFMKAGGYPKGNVVPGTEIFNPAIAKKGEACVSGDVVLMQKLESIGVQHTTTYDSVVYHFQCGEMDSRGDVKIKHEPNIVVIANDYLQGRMGEKTMWGFLLEGLPNSAGVDMDILGTTENFTENASSYIAKNFPRSSIVIQNATFIDRLSEDYFTVCYLQDNLRAMGRMSHQQEANLKYADLLVTNSRLTSLSYPEYDFEIIPIGVDDTLFKPMNKNVLRKEFNFPDTRTGIFVGDFSETKGWAKVKDLVNNHPEIFWILVSKDNQEYNLKNCRTFNRVPQDLLVKLLNCADFFVLGSPVETQCLAAIEACLCDLPIVMRNTGIFADFTEEEKSRVGIFGEDFENALIEITKLDFAPRQAIIEKGLTVDRMITKWKKIIQTARLKRDNSVTNKTEETLPFFTVVVPTYNQEQYLGAALDSLLAQTFQNWEAVIVNDGSTDGTRDVMDKYKSIDKRFRFYSKENGGVASALNEGIKNAKGQWICWLSSDDWFEQDKLETHYSAIMEKPSIKFFHSHWYLFLKESKQKIEPGLWLQIPIPEFQVTRFFWANYIHGNAVAIHRNVFDEVGLFDETLRQGQDFDMWLRISARFESHFINKRTCVTRIHKGQTTNSFVEGGVFDSTRALFNFLNQNPFEALFPFFDFSQPQNVVKAINEIVFISAREDAFLYRLGFTSILLDKLGEWVTTKLAIQFRNKALEYLREVINIHFKYPLNENIRNLFTQCLSRKKFIYKEHDVIGEAAAFAEKLVEYGNQKQALALETYLKRITTPANEIRSEKKSFTLLLHGYPLNGSYAPIFPQNILFWSVDTAGMTDNLIRHKMKLECPACNSRFNILFNYEMSSLSTTNKFICPACKAGFKYNDEKFDRDFLEFHHHKVADDTATNYSPRKVTFLVRDLSTIGGGTKIVLKHINWLLKLGCEVAVYSYSQRPDWINLNVKYFQIQREIQIKEKNVDLFIVFSIFDIPLILNTVPLSKVVHLCQGYEGYHYGKDYNELRSDKHFLTKLHAIPVKNISVSKHLVDLFKKKFSRDVEYVPNGIDHNIFSFQNFDADRPKAVLFIGNPLHPLKGFSFLSLALKSIQNSRAKIGLLKLYIVMGYEPENIDEVKRNMESEIGCKIEILFNLSSNEISDLMKKVSVVVCTSWYEGFSLPLLEAMASGTPVITTNNIGAESFCFDKKNGYVVRFGALQTLAQRIIDILYYRYDFQKILRNAYETSLEYSEEKSVRAFIKSFQRLLNISFEKVKTDLLLNEVVQKKKVVFEEPSLPESNGSPRTSIVIPVYNQLQYTQQCIESLCNTVNENIELIMVDNASIDGTQNYLSGFNNYLPVRQAGKITLKVIKNSENLGFPKAVNQGLIEASGEYIVIANNDIVFTPGWLERMLNAAESSVEVGVVGPISNLVSGVQIDKEANYSTIDEMYKYAENVRIKNSGKNFVFPRLAFLCTLIKRDVLEKIGGLDERFSPGNYEDDDFCLRAQLAGYKAVVVTDVFIHHFGSKSFKANGNQQYAQRLETNKQKFVEKWNATPDELWLQNKPINSRQYFYPIDGNPFLQSINRANVHIADKEYDLAQNEIKKAVENYPSDKSNKNVIKYDELLDLAANIALLNENIAASQEFFEAELNANPSSSTACFGLGQIFLLQELYEQAKVMFEWSVKNDESNEAAREALANVNELLGYEIKHTSLVE